jgi:hypothetical protein
MSWNTGKTEVKVPKVGPPPRGLLDGETSEQGRDYTTIAELPRAPNGYIAGDAPVLYDNPESAKVSAARIYARVEDMRAFNGFELPYLVERGDPNVQIAISTFRGQFQALLDEATVLNQNLGGRSSLSEKDFQDITANLRYLQKQYRTLENVGLVPGGTGKTSEAEKKEGFTDLMGSGDRATLTDLRDVLVKLDAEISRLTKSGTTDPVLGAQIGLFKQVRERVDAIINEVTSGSVSALDIPILKADVARFLPTLGSSTSNTGVDDSDQGGMTLIDTVRKWFLGGRWLNRDSSGALVDASGSLVGLVGREEAERIAEKILKGMSIDFRYKYTGDNEVKLAEANAVEAAANSTQSSSSPSYNDEAEADCETDGFKTYSSVAENPRGGFESTILQLEKEFRGGRPVGKSPGEPARLDWRERAKGICENIRKAGLNPADYGCFAGSTQQVGPNYSWRGHAKMVCTRLEANAVSGTAQTMGCPPVGWKGWRS